MEKDKEFMDEWDKVLGFAPEALAKMMAEPNVRDLAWGFYLCGKNIGIKSVIDKFNEHGK